MPVREDLIEVWRGACRRYSDKKGGRHVPSPSSVGRCTRQNWAKETGVPTDNWPDDEVVIASEGGTYTEPLLQAILDESGIVKTLLDQDDAAREMDEDQLEILSMNGGQLDNIGVSDGVYLKKGTYLIEYKRKGVYNMADLWREGDVKTGAPDDYMQMQALMHGFGLTHYIYIAVAWDRSAMTRLLKPKKPVTYIDVGPYVPAMATVITARAAAQKKWIDEEKDMAKVPRDYNPDGGPKADWQCRWCPVWKACQEAGE